MTFHRADNFFLNIFGRYGGCRHGRSDPDFCNRLFFFFTHRRLLLTIGRLVARSRTRFGATSEGISNAARHRGGDVGRGRAALCFTGRMREGRP